MSETETLDKLYLEWSQYHFSDPVEHANWCMDRASRAAVGTPGERQ